MNRPIGAACLAFVLAPSAVLADDSASRTRYPAIVIGSGYGGSVAAFHLARSGIRTLVLERGRQWTVTDPSSNATFATLDTVTAPGGDGRSTWLNTTCVGNSYLAFLGGVACPRTTGILEQIDDSPQTHRDASPALRMNGVRGLVAAGVGGGSLVNNGVTFQPTKQGWDVAFPREELPFMEDVWTDLRRKYFAQALTRLAPEPISADVLASDYYRGTRLLAAFATAAGYPEETPEDPSTLTFGQTSSVPVIVDWTKVRDEIAGTRVPAFILGETYWGNNSGAKKSLDARDGYLGRAVATGNVDLKPLHTVTAIAHDPKTGFFTVSVTHTDEAYNVLETLSFTSRHVFMAAGSLGTTKLLVRARETGALPRLNDAVGTRWNTNGDLAHFRFVSPTFLPQGGPAGVKITDFREAGNPVVLEQPSLRVPDAFASIPSLQPFLGAVLMIGLGVPTGKGLFHYETSSDMVILDWPLDGAANVYNRVTSIFTDPAFPGTPLVLPMAQSQQTTFHPLGGVPLGLATDTFCRVRGYRGLYVVDGALVPGAAAVTNPTLLITALAERCMDHVVGDLVDEEHRRERAPNP
jgi:cholesterol oxidase